MAWLRNLYERSRRQFSDRKRQIFIGTQHLELITAFDRKLTRLIRQRDREIATLAHTFLNSDYCGSESVQFTTLIDEIKRLERERSQPVTDTSSSLTALIIPDTDQMRGTNLSDIEIMDPKERDDLYRRRLRGLYLDLGEVVLTHRIGAHFEVEVALITQVRSQILSVRQEREAITELLPSSRRVLSWIKVFVVLLAGVITVIAAI